VRRPFGPHPSSNPQSLNPSPRPKPSTLNHDPSPRPKPSPPNPQPETLNARQTDLSEEGPAVVRGRRLSPHANLRTGTRRDAARERGRRQRERVHGGGQDEDGRAAGEKRAPHCHFVRHEGRRWANPDPRCLEPRLCGMQDVKTGWSPRRRCKVLKPSRTL